MSTSLVNVNMSARYIECTCGDAEHTIRLTFEDDHDHPEMYFQFQLRNYRSWWQRLKVAVKYLFGYECRYGHWDCVSMDYDTIDKFHRWMGQYLRNLQ